jgi:hypothetical protein
MVYVAGAVVEVQFPGKESQGELMASRARIGMSVFWSATFAVMAAGCLGAGPLAELISGPWSAIACALSAVLLAWSALDLALDGQGSARLDVCETAYLTAFGALVIVALFAALTPDAFFFCILVGAGLSASAGTLAARSEHLSADIKQRALQRMALEAAHGALLTRITRRGAVPPHRARNWRD